MPVGVASVPLDADWLVSRFHNRVGLWPGDVCNGSVCSRAGEYSLDGARTSLPPTGPNPVTEFFVFFDTDTRMESSGLGARWRRTRVRRGVCSLSTPAQAGLSPPGSFGYTAILPAKTRVSVRIADVLHAVINSLSILGGPVVVVLGTIAPTQLPLHPVVNSGPVPGRKEKRRLSNSLRSVQNLHIFTSIVAVVQRSGCVIASAFRERWLNHTADLIATGHRGFNIELIALGKAMLAFKEAVVAVSV